MGGGQGGPRELGEGRERMNECRREDPLAKVLYKHATVTAKITLLWHLIDHVSTASLDGELTESMDLCLFTPKIVGSVI